MHLLTVLSEAYNPDGRVDRRLADEFAGAGWTITRAPAADGVVEEVDVALVLMERFGREHLEPAGRLRLVQTASRGYDMVDHVAAAERGIPVCNVLTPGHAGTVAEHTFALMLAVAKRIVEGDVAIATGSWPTAGLYGAGLTELAGKTLGIVGLGEIGKEVARRAAAFGMRLVYVDSVPSPELERALEMHHVGLDELLRGADVVSLHVPLTDETTRLISADELARMKPGAMLLNTSRGAVVDLDALAVALRDGRVCAGVDVTDPEPPPVDHPLRSAPNVVRSPHVAGVTTESVQRVLDDAIANIRRLERGEPLHNVVNGVTQ